MTKVINFFFSKLSMQNYNIVNFVFIIYAHAEEEVVMEIQTCIILSSI